MTEKIDYEVNIIAVIGNCPFCATEDGEEFYESLCVESVNAIVQNWEYRLTCLGCDTCFSVTEEGDMLDLRKRLKLLEPAESSQISENA